MGRSLPSPRVKTSTQLARVHSYALADGVSRAASSSRAFRRKVSIDPTTGCAPPSTRRAVRSCKPGGSRRSGRASRPSAPVSRRRPERRRPATTASRVAENIRNYRGIVGFAGRYLRRVAKVMKRGTRARSYGPGCRLILEHLSERCAANCLMGKTANASRCSAFNDPSFDCGSRRCADACLRRDDATGRIECLNEMHVKNNSAAKCLLPREGVATRWCGVTTPAPSPRPPPRRPKKRESTTLWHSLFG